METAHMEHVLDHTKSSDFMDTTNPAYFDQSLAGLEYLQYPGDAFDMNSESLCLLSSCAGADQAKLQCRDRPPRASAALTRST